MSDRYNNICVRVDYEKGVGSGFIIRSHNHYYVITAFHCIGDEKRMVLGDNIKIWSNQEDKKIEFSFKKEDIKFFPDTGKKETNTDLAIVKIDKKVMVDRVEKNIDDINDYKKNSLVIGTNFNINVNLIGFPKSKRKKEDINLERKDLKIEDYVCNKKMGEFTEVCSPFTGGQSLSNKLDGFSGSGLFFELDNIFILNGIFTDYSNSNSSGIAVSPFKLIELFESNGLDLPITTDSYVQIKLEEVMNTIIEEELVENPSLKLKCDKFKEKIYENKEKIEKIAKGLSKENYNEPREEYVTAIIENLFLLEYFDIEYTLDEKIFSICLNGISLKIFQCEEKRYKVIKSMFSRFRIVEEEKIGVKDRIYVKGISNKDNSDFECKNCPYEKEDKCIKSFIKNKILPNISRGSVKKKFDIIEGVNEKQLEIRCGDCLDLDKKIELEGRKDKLWS